MYVTENERMKLSENRKKKKLQERNTGLVYDTRTD